MRILIEARLLDDSKTVPLKSATHSEPKRKTADFLQLGGSFPCAQKGKLGPTSVVLKTATDARRQHLAVGKLVQMCKASPVVANASRGITTEVRRDRDRGHK